VVKEISTRARFPSIAQIFKVPGWRTLLFLMVRGAVSPGAGLWSLNLGINIVKTILFLDYHYGEVWRKELLSLTIL
jgi:hypothetical protein